MAGFLVASTLIELPAVRVLPESPTRDPGAWLLGRYITVKLIGEVEGVRVHTDGRNFPGRPASAPGGAWIALEDVVFSSTEFASNRSLPGLFTHVGIAVAPAFCTVNIGVCSPKFGGVGHGVQAEYVCGPAFRFQQLYRNVWHNSYGNA